VDIPEQEPVDQFLPPYQPRFQLDTRGPCAMGQLAPPAVYMEMRHNIHLAMEEVFPLFEGTEKAFHAAFGRRYGAVEAIDCDDAEIVLVTSGTVTSTSRLVIESLRERGEKVGLLKIKLFRPFPVRWVVERVRSAAKLAVIDRNCSFGAGGIFAQELKSALCNRVQRPIVFGFIAGLGGRDVTLDLIEEIYWYTRNHDRPEQESIWMGLKEVRHAIGGV
jgi:pyruvate ferredoxin oxidoreductase alpha subunit